VDFDFWLYELKHRWKYLGAKHSPKSPLHVYNTIITFQMGIENFDFKKGKYIRKKEKNVKSKPSQQSRGQKEVSTGASGSTTNTSAAIGQVELPKPTSSEGKKET
jgi:hypothetical protein